MLLSLFTKFASVHGGYSIKYSSVHLFISGGLTIILIESCDRMKLITQKTLNLK